MSNMSRVFFGRLWRPDNWVIQLFKKSWIPRQEGKCCGYLGTDFCPISYNHRCKFFNILNIWNHHAFQNRYDKKSLCYSLTGNIIFLVIEKIIVCLEIDVIIDWMKYGISRQYMYLDIIEIWYHGNVCSG